MKKAREVLNNVYWVGARDLNCRKFHGELYQSKKEQAIMLI